MRTSQCVEILLAQEKRAENAGVFTLSQAQAVNEGEVSAGELQTHVLPCGDAEAQAAYCLQMLAAAGLCTTPACVAHCRHSFLNAAAARLAPFQRTATPILRQNPLEPYRVPQLVHLDAAVLSEETAAGSGLCVG